MYRIKTKTVSKASGRSRTARPKNYDVSEGKINMVAETSLGEEQALETRKSSKSALFPEKSLTSFQKINLVDQGIVKDDLYRFKERVGWDYNQLANILGVARAKLIAKKGEERFDKQVSERIVSLADLYTYGYEVFEDEERFNSWIFSANHALAGLAPFDYLDTQFGREEIKDLIGRIDYGVYS